MGERVRVAPLGRRDRDAACAQLLREPRQNLFLLDLLEQVAGARVLGQPRPELLLAWRGGRVVGVAALRPTIVVDACVEPEVFEALLPHLAALPAGLVRCPARLVAPLAEWLVARRRRILVDRLETLFFVDAESAAFVAMPENAIIRPAELRDLEALADAARASLREEGRPDPFEGDPRGFRLWVRHRLPRAVVVEEAGRVGFVGYADVRLREGWLLQGVYTWPERRRRGLAAAGVSELGRRAFAAGAEHVQLSVVDGNRAAMALYERLGFRAGGALRTLVFV